VSDRRHGHESRGEHAERWNAELAAYALDALDPTERRLVEEHIAGCGACGERLRWMQPAVDVLPATAPPEAPPPELKARIMEIVEREAAVAAAPPAEEAAGRGPRLGLARFRLRPALAGLGAAVLLAAAIAGYALRSGDDGDRSAPAVYAAHAESGSGASGRLEVEGDAGMLHVAELPPAGRGRVYQAWIEDAAGAGGAIRPSSVFVVSGDGEGDVAIPHGLAGARRVMVTREPEGGSRRPSEGSLLTVEMG
jgi:anti-sigma-K factor RskA